MPASRGFATTDRRPGHRRQRNRLQRRQRGHHPPAAVSRPCSASRGSPTGTAAGCRDKRHRWANFPRSARPEPGRFPTSPGILPSTAWATASSPATVRRNAVSARTRLSELFSFARRGARYWQGSSPSDECRNNGPRVVMLSHNVWQRRFASDPSDCRALAHVERSGQAVTVVAVLPPTFDFSSVFAPASRIDLFVPFPLTPETSRMGKTFADRRAYEAGSSSRAGREKESACARAANHT